MVSYNTIQSHVPYSGYVKPFQSGEWICASHVVELLFFAGHYGQIVVSIFNDNHQLFLSIPLRKCKTEAMEKAGTFQIGLMLVVRVSSPGCRQGLGLGHLATCSESDASVLLTCLCGSMSSAWEDN